MRLPFALILAASAACAAPVNLAPEAAYGVTIYGYTYQGQVIPGTNTPAPANGFLPAPPWQGPPQTLTDGRRDGSAVISWFWSNMDKRIVARFDLRRVADVSALRAWPSQGAPKFDGASARCAVTEDALAGAPELKLQAEGEGMAWTGTAEQVRYVEITFSSGVPQMSLAEVEILGETASASPPPPGLIEVKPRDLAPLIALPEIPEGAVNLARLPGTMLSLSSSHYDDKTRKLAEDDSAAQSDPTGTALVDGTHSGGVRSFTGWYCAKHLRAEFDLPAPAELDRVVVWSSGHGAARSFINCVKVWLQAGEGAAWVPAGETWNPVLPGEVPAAEYPIILPPTGKPATSVRVELSGVAQSADFMQVGEIELWGRGTGQPLVAKPWRVKAPIPEVQPVPTETLDASYDWLQRERLRGMYGYIGQWADADLLDHITAAGFNCMIVHTMSTTHREDGWPAEVQQWVKVQQERGLRIIISWPFGSDERYGNTQFGAYQPGGGAVWRRGPCPLSREYWDRVVGDRAVISAEAGLTGMVVDMEMYGADSTRYPGPCYCDTCWGRFLEEHIEGVAADEVPLPDRPAWTAANRLSADYARWQELEVTAILTDIRERVRKANPGFLLGNLLDPESLPGLARGFGTASMPALVFSELEYHGGIDGVPGRLEQLRARGYPVWYIPGLWIKPVTPPKLPELVRKVGPGSGGFWIWSDAAFSPNASGEYAHAAEYSHDDYWQAFRQANDALTEALASDARPQAAPQTGPLATVPRIVGPAPTDADWEQAAVLGPFLDYRSGKAAAAPTVVRALWDGTRLHLRARCEEPQPEKMVVRDAPRDDGSLWEQDCLEVFWMRPGSGAYAHIVINSAGVVADSFSDGIRPEDPGWNAPIEATASRDDAGWELVLSLPLAADGAGEIPPGGELRVELARHRPGGGETTCWAPTGGMYRAAPNLWGTLVLQ